MSREQPGVKFARYVDDIVVHVETRKHAQDLLAKIGRRMAEVGLSLHPSKTRIVYCQDHRRRAHHEHRSFTFLGYTFAPRLVRMADGRKFVSFLPGVSR